jgi:hypothetical protein
LWDLSSGTEFNVGNPLIPIYFKNGKPEKVHSKYFVCSSSADNVVKNIIIPDGINEIDIGTKITIYFVYGNN